MGSYHPDDGDDFRRYSAKHPEAQDWASRIRDGELRDAVKQRDSAWGDLRIRVERNEFGHWEGIVTVTTGGTGSQPHFVRDLPPSHQPLFPNWANPPLVERNRLSFHPETFPVLRA